MKRYSSEIKAPKTSRKRYRRGKEAHKTISAETMVCEKLQNNAAKMKNKKISVRTIVLNSSTIVPEVNI